MALEDVVNAGRIYHPANSFRGVYVDRSGNLKVTPSNENLAEVVSNLLYNVPQEVRNTAIERAIANPGILPSMIAAGIEDGKAQLTAAAKDNYGEVIRDSSPNELIRITLDVPDDKKGFYGIRRKLQDTAEEIGKEIDDEEVLNSLDASDVASIKKDYADTFKPAAWKVFIMQQDGDFIKKHALMYMRYACNKFLKDNKFINNEGTADADRMKAYIESHLSDEAYFQIGKIYSSSRLRTEGD